MWRAQEGKPRRRKEKGLVALDDGYHLEQVAGPVVTATYQPKEWLLPINKNPGATLTRPGAKLRGALVHDFDAFAEGFQDRSNDGELF